MNLGILSFLYCQRTGLASFSAGVKDAPDKRAASLKILGVFRFIRVGLSSDLDMAFEACFGDWIQLEHLAFAGAVAYPCGEDPGACGAVVLPSQPAVGFVGVCSPRPAQYLIVNDTACGVEGLAGTNVAVVGCPNLYNGIERAYQRPPWLSVPAFDSLARFLLPCLHPLLG